MVIKFCEIIFSLFDNFMPIVKKLQPANSSLSSKHGCGIYFDSEMQVRVGTVTMETNMLGTLKGKANTNFDRRGKPKERKYHVTGKYS